MNLMVTLIVQLSCEVPVTTLVFQEMIISVDVLMKMILTFPAGGELYREGQISRNEHLEI